MLFLPSRRENRTTDFLTALSKQRAVRRRTLTGGFVGFVASEVIDEPINHG